MMKQLLNATISKTIPLNPLRFNRLLNNLKKYNLKYSFNKFQASLIIDKDTSIIFLFLTPLRISKIQQKKL